MKSGVKQAILDGSGTVIGAMIMAFGISLFLLPNQLSTGGCINWWNRINCKFNKIIIYLISLWG